MSQPVILEKPDLILASSSAYRAALLARLGVPFSQRHPQVDERQGDGESAAALAQRLARTKAHALTLTGPARVIGSDQVAELATPGDPPGHGVILGKPGGVAQACRQLSAMAGKRVHFHTAVCLLDTANGRCLEALDITIVHLRALDAATIERYVAHEQPLDCAGSFKAEGLGISLFERIDSHDPTALVGLPLIATARLLRQAGVSIP